MLGKCIDHSNHDSKAVKYNSRKIIIRQSRQCAYVAKVPNYKVMCRVCLVWVGHDVRENEIHHEWENIFDANNFVTLLCNIVSKHAHKPNRHQKTMPRNDMAKQHREEPKRGVHTVDSNCRYKHIVSEMSRTPADRKFCGQSSFSSQDQSGSMIPVLISTLSTHDINNKHQRQKLRDTSCLPCTSSTTVLKASIQIASLKSEKIWFAQHSQPRK